MLSIRIIAATVAAMATVAVHAVTGITTQPSAFEPGSPVLSLDLTSAQGVVAAPAVMPHGVIAAPVAAPAPAAASHRTPARVVSALAPVHYSLSWASTTPAYAQGGLLGGLACAPTAAAMVTAHYAATAGLGSRTPADFVANLQPGEFVAGQGVPYMALARQLADLGYTHLTGTMGNNQAALRADLGAGPVIATTNGDTLGRSGSHSLVVVALSDDGSQVIVNDPTTGAQSALSWTRFNGLWAGGSYGVMLIRP